MDILTWETNPFDTDIYAPDVAPGSGTSQEVAMSGSSSDVRLSGSSFTASLSGSSSSADLRGTA